MSLLIIVLILAFLAYQDLKFRAINIFVFLFLIISFLTYRYFNKIPLATVDVFINCSFIMILITVLLLYFRFRFKSWDLLKKGLGSGDLVFWIVVCFLLPFEQFIIWFNLSIILALIFHLLLRSKTWYGNADKIPLAGLQAVVLMIFIIIS